MNEIYNDAQLDALLIPIVREVVEYAIEEANKELRAQIETDIYMANEPEVYERTWQFENSWVNQTSDTSRGATGELYEDTSLMTFNPDKYQHGSNFSGDISEYLADIIFEGRAGWLFGYGYWMEKRDAWTPVIEKIEKKQLEQWIRKGFKQYGITLRKQN